MSSEWHQLTIADIADINPRRLIQKGTCAPFVEMANVPTHSRDIDDTITTREHKGSGSKFQNGDTLLARITPCLENGKTALVSCLPDDVIGHGSTEFIVLAPKNENDTSFIYYLVRSDAFRDYAINRMEGTSGRQRVPTAAVAGYEFRCPPPLERKELSDFLSAIDDRIAILRQTNKTLEAIAQAIFKSWFVDFDPVRAKMEGRPPEGMDEETAALFPNAFEESELGLVPKGWLPLTLGSFIELAYGKALRADIRVAGNVPVYGSGGITGWHNTALITEPSIIVGRKGTVGSLYWESRPFFPIDTVFYVKTNKPLVYVYELLKQLPLRDMNTDAAVPGLNRENAYRLLAPLPTDPILDKFEETAKALRKNIDHNNVRKELLKHLRDTLLPRLISGQLRLPEAEALATEACI